MPFDFDSFPQDPSTLLKLYEDMLHARLLEEKMLVWLRQGKISKWFSGIGQEAISVGVTHALEAHEWILPAHRNLGVFLGRKFPVERLIAQWMGKAEGYTHGRDRSFHFGSKEHHVWGMISHLGPQLSVACGLALAAKIKNEHKVVLAITGEGGTSEGDFHEALNIASVWKLPVVFLVENNGYAISTPTSKQFNCESIVDKAPGYGIDGLQIDGNNVVEVYSTIQQVAQSMRENPRPVLIEAITFRVRGHEEATGTDYVPEEILKSWKDKDPILHFEKYLMKEEYIVPETISHIRSHIQDSIDVAAQMALSMQEFIPSSSYKEENSVFAPSEIPHHEPMLQTEDPMLRFVDAIRESMLQQMKENDQLVLLGQDIGVYGGVFKATEGLQSLFGDHRVYDTPLCESAILGTALGLAGENIRSIVEMQFSDFVSSGFTQLVQNIAKIYYRWQLPASLVVRMPCGAGTGSGPFHAQTNEAWFFHCPGLKIVYPSTPYDAKGLLNTAILDPNPVLFFEHKALYRSITDQVPAEAYSIEIGKAKKVIEGNDLTIVTYGMGVVKALDVLNELQASVDLIDLRSLQPWDKLMVLDSVKSTGKVLILTEASLQGSIASEIAAWLSEHAFQFLDAPIKRLGALETPIPFNRGLEDQYLPYWKLKDEIESLLRY